MSQGAQVQQTAKDLEGGSASRFVTMFHKIAGQVTCLS